MTLTKLQQEAFTLYKTLRPVKLDKEKVIQNYYTPAYVSRNQDTCLRCGGKCGQINQYAKTEIKSAYHSEYTPKPGAKCPHCHHRFTNFSYVWYNAWIGYFAQYQRKGDWQVIRMHYVQMNPHRKNQQSTFKIVPDNYQVWYHQSGVRVTIAHNTSFMPRRKFNPLSEWSEMNIRQDNDSDYINYAIDEHQIISLAPWFKETINRVRNQKNIFDNFSLINDTMKNIRKMKLHPYFETLMKQGRTKLVTQISLSDMRKYAPQIRIAVFRNNLDIQNWNLYKDMLRFLDQLQMDTHSPKYIVPADIKAWHDHLWNIIQAKRREEELKRQRLTLEQYLPIYQKEHKRFFCIYIPTSKFIIRPIYTPMEMVEEGEHMHHCVGNYYKYKNSLILVARTHKNERIATIEIDIKEHKIIQIRGVNNSKPKLYDDIMTTLTNRLNDIIHPAVYKFKQAA